MPCGDTAGGRLGGSAGAPDVKKGPWTPFREFGSGRRGDGDCRFLLAPSTCYGERSELCSFLWLSPTTPNFPPWDHARSPLQTCSPQTLISLRDLLRPPPSCGPGSLLSRASLLPLQNLASGVPGTDSLPYYSAPACRKTDSIPVTPTLSQTLSELNPRLLRLQPCPGPASTRFSAAPPFHSPGPPLPESSPPQPAPLASLCFRLDALTRVQSSGFFFPSYRGNFEISVVWLITKLYKKDSTAESMRSRGSRNGGGCIAAMERGSWIVCEVNCRTTAVAAAGTLLPPPAPSRGVLL